MSKLLDNANENNFKERFKLHYIWTINDMFNKTFLDVDECIKVTEIFINKIFREPEIDDGEYAFRINDYVDLNVNVDGGRPNVLGWQLVLDRSTERHVIHVNKDTFKSIYKPRIKSELKPEWETLYPDSEKISTDEVMMCVLGFFKTLEFYLSKEEPILEMNMFNIINTINNGYCNVVM